MELMLGKSKEIKEDELHIIKNKKFNLVFII